MYTSPSLLVSLTAVSPRPAQSVSSYMINEGWILLESKNSGELRFLCTGHARGISLVEVVIRSPNVQDWEVFLSNMDSNLIQIA